MDHPDAKDYKQYESRVTEKGKTISHVVVVEAKNGSEAKRILLVKYPKCSVGSIQEKKSSLKKFEAKVTPKGKTTSISVVIEAKNKDEAKKLLKIQYQNCLISSVKEVD